MRGDPYVPVFRQGARIKPGSLLLKGDQPEQLNIEVVVRKRLSLEFLGIKIDVISSPLPFEGISYRAADVLSEPAGQDLVAIFFLIDDDHGCFLV